MNEHLFYAYIGRLVLTFLLGVSSIVALYLAVKSLSAIISSKKQTFEIHVLGIVNAKAGTVAGASLLVSVILAAATISSIPDIKLPDGTQVTWKYNKNQVKVETPTLVTVKPDHKLDDVTVMSVFKAALKESDLKVDGSFLGSDENLSFAIGSDSSPMVTLMLLGNSGKIEIQYKLEEKGDKLLFVPKSLSATKER